MTRLRAVAVLTALAVIALGSYLVFDTGDSRTDSAEALLLRAREAMAAESFSFVDDDCPYCPLPVVTEYAPPNRLKLSNSRGHDDRRYYLIIGDTGYMSSAGTRWVTGDDPRLGVLRLSDPRFLLNVVRDPAFDGEEQVDGRTTRVVTATMDIDAFLGQAIFADLDDESEVAARQALDGFSVRFWIDRQNHRVLQMENSFRDSSEDPTRLVFDFETPVDLPESVESMDEEVAHRISQEVEPGARTLLRAVGEYQARNGRYPDAVDPGTLGEFLTGEWPANPFNGQPMRQSDRPGDFRYTVKGNGEHIELAFRGWDAVLMFYDSARFGPIDLGPTR